MANGINRVILVGNLGKDPEVQSFDNGVKKAAFSLATTESFKNKDGGRTEHTEWHNIVLWRGLAEIAERFLRKGSSVYIEGKIRRREYEDESKQKRYIYEIIADNMTMLGGGPKRESSSDDNSSSHVSDSGTFTPPVESSSGADDLPF